MSNLKNSSYILQTKIENIISSFFHSKKNSNCILELEELLLSEDEECILTSIKYVTVLFSKIFSKSMMCTSYELREAQEKYRIWLLNLYNDFIAHLLGYLSHTSAKVREASFHALLTFVQFEGKYPLKCVQKDAWFFPSSLFEKIILEMASSSTDQRHLIKKFQKYTIYDDIKLYLLKIVQKLLHSDAEVSDTFLQNCFYLLCSFKYPKEFPTAEDTSDSPNTFLAKKGVLIPFYLKEKLFCKLFSAVWIQFLKHELPPPLHQKVLIVLHEQVIPYLQNPCLLTDFLTDSYNIGGVTSLLALNGLFFLIQKYNVEYPDFFLKLYALFDESSVNGKFNAKFFALSDLFLSSTHLPAYMVAAFIKKLSRLSLISKTTSVLKSILLIYNLLIRHPSLHILVHRIDPKELSGDPYDFNAVDPSESKAMESSLWEIKSLQFHVNPEVSRKTKLINTELPKLEFDMSLVRDFSMNDLYQKERKRKFIEAPLAVQKLSHKEGWWLLCKKMKPDCTQ